MQAAAAIINLRLRPGDTRNRPRPTAVGRSRRRQSQSAELGSTMIELQLLGGLGIEGLGLSPNARARRRHPLALLALVAAAAPRAIGREKIMGFLWPESDSARANNSLRQTLFWLRRDLREDLFQPETASGIRLDSTKLVVDLWVFREAMRRRDPAAAVRVYGGAFLDSFQIAGVCEFSHWVESKRERVEREYISALGALARQAEEEVRYDDAVSWRRRQAAADPFSSRSALALLRALATAGDRPGALEYAGVYESIVRQHLEIEPDPAVVEFVTSLRHLSATETRARSDRDGPAREPLRAIPAAPLESAAAIGAAEPAAEPAHEPGPTTVMAPNGARTKRGGRRRGARLARLGAAAALASFGIVAGRATIRGTGDAATAAAQTVTVVASGVTHVAGRDPANRLIACAGPACPAGGLPQDAYVVSRHAAYATPVAGTSYIAPVPDWTTARPPGYNCCTTATFESEFMLPANAVSARVVISVLADNAATVVINGVEFGRQPDRWEPGNYGAQPSTFSTTFPPDPGGINRLHLTVWDGGGALALQYHAVVTYERGGDAVRDSTAER
ncbi:MAG TPA: BTAD domain-containing putative transcriptional regulator [Longimicrobiales bacterium]|nr:BTAD domain-containing putative transcriptional regulator [Longimicrobiales bacterium]